ncbi:hypothetical protein EJ08DRAFT_663212 [Tothia fuscella]|uniref:Uncharacterized protein n=1 Tax=Tothia fuscella TaxID=1048955 RepID=A0A9P4NLS7_9PEZI|nr:hypothetical protein EJ08DRAFT_663212 [Tothia fuscella]
MSSSTPSKKFKIEPIESSTKSSRKSPQQLIDTTSSSSRKADSHDPIGTKVKKRFLPQPIETTTSSSKRKDLDVARSSPRRFAPQLLETSTEQTRRTSKNVVEGTPKPRSRFAPQLMETTTASRRQLANSPTTPGTATNVSSIVSSIAEDKPARKKFTPQLIDTAKRTRKAGDSRPAHLLTDRTDAMPADIDASGRFSSGVIPSAPRNVVSVHFAPTMSSAEARRLGIPLAKRQYTDCSLRQHSFRVPDLDPIESSESGEDSDGPTSPGSPSSDFSSQTYNDATRMRESIDASSSGYLLELAAKAAEKQMRDQALAAFPNDDRHTPVDHWIDRDADDSSVMSSRSELDHRRFGSVNWKLKDLRKRHEELEEKEVKEIRQKEARRQRLLRQQDAIPWENPFLKDALTPTVWTRDAEMERMRKKARPPMLGSDILFPRCESPAPARFDVTQGSYSVRTAMCYLTEQSDDDVCKEGLWKGTDAGDCGLWSQPASRAPSPGGLWAGCCKGSSLTPPRGPTGLMTPRIDDDMPNPMEIQDNGTMLRYLPPSPPASNSGMANLDEKLEREQAIEEEFNDAFVTQVYNYLSLGYPSLARAFDGEISKISRVPISELRLDDNLAAARGYIRLGEDECAKEDGINEDMCARWKALRMYIHEWARQQSGMIQPKHSLGGFGLLARRGSWAW